MAAPLADPGEYHGPDGFLEMFANWTEGFDDYVQEAEEYIEAGDHVIARVFQHGTRHLERRPGRTPLLVPPHLAEGKLVRMGVHGSEQTGPRSRGLTE